MPAKAFAVMSDSEIAATTPPSTAGQVHVTVLNPAGANADSDDNEFTFTLTLARRRSLHVDPAGASDRRRQLTATATASSGFPSVSRSTRSTSGCTISGATVTFGAPAGSCVLDADQSGDGSYARRAAGQAGDHRLERRGHDGADGAVRGRRRHWHADNVTIACSATDQEPGLADPGDARFQLSTNVPAGSETTDAATGTRTVCDKAGNCATAGPVTGNKVDRKAPALIVPANLTVNATKPGGAVVRFSASASDGTDAAPRLVCAPASGSTLAIGTTTIDCTATDHAENKTSAHFTIKVKSAPEQIADLTSKLRSYLKFKPLLDRLEAKLQKASSSFVRNHRQPACVALNLFIAGVKAAPANYLTAAHKTELIADANRIRGVIDC